MAILDLSHEVGPSALVPAVTAGEPAAAEVNPNPLSHTNSFTQYLELRDANARFTPFEGPAVDEIRTATGEWLAGRVVSDETMPVAQHRVETLVGRLRRQQGYPVRSFELDTTEALLTAAREHEALMALGEAAAEDFPALGDDPERAMPILRYVREDQRADFLDGLPQSLQALAPRPQRPVAETTPPATGGERGFRALWHRTRALGRRALEAMHLRRPERAVGHTAVAAEVEVDTPLGVVIEAKSATAVSQEIVGRIAGWNSELPTETAAPREVITNTGERLLLMSFWDNGDPDYEDLTAQIVAGRLTEYQNHDLLGKDATPDDIRGPHVEMMALVNEEGRVVASLRKVHATGATLIMLPSYRKFVKEGAFDPEGLALLREHANPDREVVEIAALWKSSEHAADGTIRYDAEAKVALYRAAMQDSLARGEGVDERSELWFMGIVQAEYAGLIKTYGRHVVHTLGRAISVQGENANEKVRLRPVMVDSGTFYADMATEIAEARAAGDDSRWASRGATLGMFLLGAPWHVISPATRAILKGALGSVS